MQTRYQSASGVCVTESKDQTFRVDTFDSIRYIAFSFRGDSQWKLVLAEMIPALWPGITEERRRKGKSGRPRSGRKMLASPFLFVETLQRYRAARRRVYSRRNFLPGVFPRGYSSRETEPCTNLPTRSHRSTIPRSILPAEIIDRSLRIQRTALEHREKLLCSSRTRFVFLSVSRTLVSSVTHLPSIQI